MPLPESAVTSEAYRTPRSYTEGVKLPRAPEAIRDAISNLTDVVWRQAKFHGGKGAHDELCWARADAYGALVTEINKAIARAQTVDDV